MKVKLSDDHWSLLREIQWQGGVLFVREKTDAEFYRELLKSGYLYGEAASGGRHRYELTLQGREKRFARCDLKHA
jgi:hypothetical protein